MNVLALQYWFYYQFLNLHWRLSAFAYETLLLGDVNVNKYVQILWVIQSWHNEDLSWFDSNGFLK